MPKVTVPIPHTGAAGRVIYVTNLNDDGPGSLRDAAEANGPRIVMFRTSGTIRLRDVIRIKNPFIYIAGQTAPGDGIAIEGGGFSIQTHDVLIRYLRIRPGDARNGASPQSRDAVAVAEEGIYNVVLDHNSFSWGVDENASIWFPVRNVTYSYNIIAEGLMYSIHPAGKQGYGMLLGHHATNISIHNNLFAHNNERNPIIQGGTESGVIDPAERAMVREVIGLAERPVSDIMTRRRDVYWVDVADDPKVLKAELRQCPFSRVVVAKGGSI
ncbi:hypothetical protein HC928_10960, partial [bacterium]|nr:hypothetical protein [bacterium]